MPSRHGYETRFDKFTGNAIDAARHQSSGLGVYLKYATNFCAKCQKDKSTKGGKKRGGLMVCADCIAQKTEGARVRG